MPYHLGDDAEEGEVSDEDSADEIEDECKFKLHYVSYRFGYNFYPQCVAIKIAAVLESLQYGGCGAKGIFIESFFVLGHIDTQMLIESRIFVS